MVRQFSPIELKKLRKEAFNRAESLTFNGFSDHVTSNLKTAGSKLVVIGLFRLIAEVGELVENLLPQLETVLDKRYVDLLEHLVNTGEVLGQIEKQIGQERSDEYRVLTDEQVSKLTSKEVVKTEGTCYELGDVFFTLAALTASLGFRPGIPASFNIFKLHVRFGGKTFTTEASKQRQDKELI